MKHRLSRSALAALLLGGLALGGCGEAKRTGDEAPPSPAAAAPTSAGPKIVAVQASHDFGEVRQGEEVTHVFKLKNEGGSDLIIERAKGS